MIFEIGLLCCAYILGLLCWTLPFGTILCVTLFLGIALARSPQSPIPTPQVLRYSPTARWWFIAALMSLLAAVHLWVKLPQPTSTDISRLIIPPQTSLSVKVSGTIERRPALTRRGSFQVWLNAKQVVTEQGSQPITGSLYVTLPLKIPKGLHPGQTVKVMGQLYRPQATTRPQGFDFAAFLARDGAFAGLKSTQVQIENPGSSWGGWAVPERIVRSLQKGTNPRIGALLGALVLGKEAADVPYDLRDNFVQVGLAHALAASGFQVSLILAVVLNLGQFLPNSQKIGIGTGALLLLLYNPLWIWDLGFQLSMLATLGLLVTVPSLVKGLDVLPPTLATAIAVPLAATIWTLPLQLHTFGVLPLYSLVANVLTALLLSALTIGGFIASLLALLWPDLGSLAAGVLFWPTQLLVSIVTFMSELPGHALAIGSISLLQLLGLYGLIGAVWLLPWWQKQWRLAAILGFLMLVIPLWQIQTQRLLVTVFDQTRMPMMVVEHPKGTVVLNSGNSLTADQSLVPFLQQEGINRIDWAIATRPDDPTKSGWSALLERMPIRNLSRCIPQAVAMMGKSHLHPQRELEVNPQESLRLGPIQMVLWRAQPTILELSMDVQRWLLVDGSNETDFATWLSTVEIPSMDVLWWTGDSLSPALAEQLHPQVLLLSERKMGKDAIADLEAVVPQVLWTERDGTVQWTPRSGFSSTVNPGENTLSVF